MKRILLFFLVGVVAANCSAVLLDLNIPDWRGDDGTTYQEWDFLTGDNPAAPDAYVNDYGVPSVAIGGDNSIWLKENLGHEGVWSVYSDSMKVTISNVDIENPYKEIWLQIIYKEELLIWTDPRESSLTLVDKQVLESGYIYAAYSIIIEPNPETEDIIIRPYMCSAFIDSLIIDTICVPEPMTIGFLGLGGALLALKRRR